MRIPFTKYDIKLSKRGIEFVDGRTGKPISFDGIRNKFFVNKASPLLENIYHTIATEFSKIELFLAEDRFEETGEHIYNRLSSHSNYHVLATRPNALQTKSEMLYTVAYQLAKYGNALVRIVRADFDDRNIVTALEPMNCGDYYFGQGYEINGTLYLKLKEKSSGKIILLDYDDIIHLRRNPNDVFYGDANNSFELDNFVTLFDENLSAMITQQPVYDQL